MKFTNEQVEYARARLERILFPGKPVSVMVRSVAQSSKKLSVLVAYEGEVEDITHSVAVLCGYHVNDHHELRAHGCGLDLGHEVVYRLSKKLWPEADGMALRYVKM